MPPPQLQLVEAGIENFKPLKPMVVQMSLNVEVVIHTRESIRGFQISVGGEVTNLSLQLIIFNI